MNHKRPTPQLQAPSFEEAKLELEIVMLKHNLAQQKMNEFFIKQIDIIIKRLDILDNVVLNIPEEGK